jgi:hypothetical protein
VLSYFLKLFLAKQYTWQHTTGASKRSAADSGNIAPTNAPSGKETNVNNQTTAVLNEFQTESNLDGTLSIVIVFGATGDLVNR